MKISTKGRYALEAILYMATIKVQKDDEYININQIVEATNIPIRYLEQIFYTLRKVGIINALRGSNGGYSIVEDIDNLTVGKILKAVETSMVPVPCVEQMDYCTSNIEDCKTRDMWVLLTDTVQSVFESVTIKDLVEAYTN